MTVSRLATYINTMKDSLLYARQNWDPKEHSIMLSYEEYGELIADREWIMYGPDLQELDTARRFMGVRIYVVDYLPGELRSAKH